MIIDTISQTILVADPRQDVNPQRRRQSRRRRLLHAITVDAGDECGKALIVGFGKVIERCPEFGLQRDRCAMAF